MAENAIFSFTCLGISVTMQCPLRCRHCITRSGPEITRQMSEDEALHYIRSARHAVDHIGFTGGEPLLDQARLLRLIEAAKAERYVVSVMTSGHWGARPDHAKEIIGRMKAAGLDMLGVSLDRYHLDFIDVSRCCNIAEAADEHGIPLAVRVIAEPGDDFAEQVKALLAHTKASVHSHFPVRLGRAETLAAAAFRHSMTPPADSCETVTALDIEPGGKVYACCGPGPYMHGGNPLALGNALEEDLFAIIQKALANPFMKVINTRGPKGLLDDLHAHGHARIVPLRAYYTDTCQLCLDICNNPQAVAVLREIYADPETQRTQNAMQFAKMVGEFLEIRRFRQDTGDRHAS
ncbi:MAG: radical SAM protein [Rhodocyclales bacterium]|nr:radical SAM protein [Rhodocyclales bacterium]